MNENYKKLEKLFKDEKVVNNFMYDLLAVLKNNGLEIYPNKKISIEKASEGQLSILIPVKWVN